MRQLAGAEGGKEFGNFTTLPNEGVIYLDGEIKNGSDENFLNALSDLKTTKAVVLNSPGGGVVFSHTFLFTYIIQIKSMREMCCHSALANMGSTQTFEACVAAIR